MRSVFPFSKLRTFGFLFCALFISLILAAVLGSVIVLVIVRPSGLSEMVRILCEKYEYLIAASATIFSGLFVIFGVMIGIKDQRDKEEDDRKKKLGAIISTLPVAFKELSQVCKNLAIDVAGRKDKFDSNNIHLSETSMTAINSAITYLTADECEDYCKLIHYYRISIANYKDFLERNSNNNNQKISREDKNLIVELISLQSIAQVHAHFSFQRKLEFDMELCKNQFKMNMKRYDRVAGEDTDESIEEIFDIKFDRGLEFGNAYVGFLNDDYLRKYNFILEFLSS